MLTLKADELNLIYDWMYDNTDYNEFRNDGKTIFVADVDINTEEVYSSSSFDLEEIYNKAYYAKHGKYPY